MEMKLFSAAYLNFYFIIIKICLIKQIIRSSISMYAFYDIWSEGTYYEDTVNHIFKFWSRTVL